MSAIGVSDLELARKLSELVKFGADSHVIVNSDDGGEFRPKVHPVLATESLLLKDSQTAVFESLDDDKFGFTRVD